MRKIQSLNHEYDSLEEALKGSIIFEKKFNNLKRFKSNLMFESKIEFGDKCNFKVEVYESL